VRVFNFRDGAAGEILKKTREAAAALPRAMPPANFQIELK